MILIDSNVFMYLVGAPHPNKDNAQRLLEKLVGERKRLVTDELVLKEIRDRYTAIRQPDAIQPTLDALDELVDAVFPFDGDVMDRMERIVSRRRGLSVRNVMHLAVMDLHGIKEILSFDPGFDGFPGVTRLS